jgi:hypothetical protein
MEGILVISHVTTLTPCDAKAAGNATPLGIPLPLHGACRGALYGRSAAPYSAPYTSAPFSLPQI